MMRTQRGGRGEVVDQQIQQMEGMCFVNGVG